MYFFIGCSVSVKASTKFQPKLKPKPKPKPKPSTHPEQKPAPTPATQFVEAPTIADNELLGRTEEEQPGNDANRISANIDDDLQYAFDKLQQEVGKFTLRFHDFYYHICLICFRIEHRMLNHFISWIRLMTFFPNLQQQQVSERHIM